LAGTYDHVFQERATFQQIFEYLPDMSRLANYQINSRSTLAVPVSGIVGLAVSYDVRYVNEPPAGRYKADRFFTAGLQLTK
jgi:putative salt-induced outer membrane protein YdiY